jgi:MiaB-like tRNA modifying enzyme
MRYVYIETYGCANNFAESQIMAGLLERVGIRIVKDPEHADVIIVNTCDVKLTTRNKILDRLRFLSKKFGEEKLLIAGCMPEIELSVLRDQFPKASILSTNHIDEIVKAVSEILNGNRVEFVGRKFVEKICLPKIRDNPVINIVPICSGCNGACAFCATKFAKGNVFSFSEEKIVKEIFDSKQSGVKEFYLTGQDISSYGLDSYEKSRLPELLQKILMVVKGKYFIRLGMMNPKNVLQISNELLKIYKDDRIFKFLHIPVQSGSNKILKKMNRDYTIEEFIDIVNKFRRHFPEMTIWTDIIVGFPDESEDDFEKSVELVRQLKFDYVNVSRFSPHHVLKVSKEKQIPTEIQKERSRILSSLVNKIETKHG